MPRSPGRPVVIVLLACWVVLCGTARGQMTFKLLAPGTGWAAHGDRLSWTTDGGAHWSDITPHLPNGEQPGGLCSTFFLDRTTGWALFCSESDEPMQSQGGNSAISDGSRRAAPQFTYRLASTGDAGVTWSVKDLAVPGVRHNFPQLGRGSVSFADPLEGWINFDLATGEHSGYLIRTDDGGHAWSIVGGAGAGPVLFHGAVGWSLWPAENTLFCTRNGAATWEEVVLKRPALPFPEDIPVLYALPAYSDARHALLPVLYRPEEGSTKTPQIVLYSSDDDGQHWNSIRLLPAPDAAHGSREKAPAATAAGRPPVTTIAEGALVLATLSGETLTLTTLSLSHSGPVTVRANLAAAPAEGAPAAASPIAALDSVDRLSFLNAREGWASATSPVCGPATSRCTQLLATTDGGATWTNITPSF